jgi:hypothetical protein
VADVEVDTGTIPILSASLEDVTMPNEAYLLAPTPEEEVC